jgi:hypothetical protein
VRSLMLVLRAIQEQGIRQCHGQLAAGSHMSAAIAYTSPGPAQWRRARHSLSLTVPAQLATNHLLSQKHELVP